MAYISNHNGQTIDDAVNTVNNFDMSQLRDFFYPIGSIYTSTQSTSPATLFGGTWVQIKDTFLLTAGDTYSAGATGGTATHIHTSAAHTHTTAAHTLTADEMPKHRHYPANYNTAGSESGYKRYFTTNLDTSSESVARQLMGSGGSRYAMAATTSGDITQTATTDYQGASASHSHGNTGSTTPGNTGVSSSLPPYRVVYAWERTS